MKIESHTSSTVTMDTYQILTENHGSVTYIEYIEGGKLIDSLLRDEDGNNIDDPALLEEVEEFIDAHIDAEE